MLEVRELSAGYGDSEIIRDLNLEVRSGEAVCLIGANRAGKSTLLKCIAGLVRTSRGHIKVDGADLTTRPASSRFGAGVALVPEGRRVFAPMTVLENLEMGAFRRLWPRKDRKVNEDLDFIFDFFPRLGERKSQLAGLLSGGEQQMLAIGRALMSRPRMILLDEPSMGLAPLVVKEIFSIIRKLNQEGKAILIAEQSAGSALVSTTRAYILTDGRIVRSGTSAELLADEALQNSYLDLEPQAVAQRS